MDNLLQEIRINGYYAQLLESEYGFEDQDLTDKSIPTIRDSLKDTDDFLRKLNNDTNKSFIIPPNCRYYEEFAHDEKMFVIEEPPAYRTISVSASMDYEVTQLETNGKIEEYGIDTHYYCDYTNKPFKFTLAFPYVVFIFLLNGNKLQSGYVFLRKARLTGLSDYLMKIPMFNVNTNQSVCFGDNIRGDFPNENRAIENAIMTFWSAEFNTDYRYNYEAYNGVAGVGSYIEWQALSQKDPMFIYNVDWIKYNMNLGDMINKLKSDYKLRPKGGLSFSKLKRYFTSPMEMPNQEEVDTYNKLYYDVAEGHSLSNNCYLHVGDPIIWADRVAYVESFLGNIEDYDISHMKLKFADGDRVTIKLTEKVTDYLIEKLKSARFKESANLKNGVEVKEGDILKLKTSSGRELYKKIRDLRETSDGLTEAKIGSSFYLIENLEGEVYNVQQSDVVHEDKVLTRDHTYFIINSFRGGALTPSKLYQFNGLDIDEYSDNNGLALDFFNVDYPDDTFKMSFNTRSSIYGNRDILLDIDECERMPSIFSIGKRLIKTRDNNEVYHSREYGLIVRSRNGRHSGGEEISTELYIEEVADEVLKNEGATLEVRGLAQYINFNVGDKVVWADWDNPADMLMSKTIEAFLVNIDQNSIDIVLKDKDDNLMTVQFINVGDHLTSIQIGKLRHISNRHGDLSSGMKIKANAPYIRNFPKKDVNIIIGFLTDTGIDEPLVLCSNCCTLWYNDVLERFDITSPSDPKWKNMSYAPIDISKIKPQAGDLMIDNGFTTRNETGYMIVYQTGYRAFRLKHLHSTFYEDIYSLDAYRLKRLKFDGFLSPRISANEISHGPRIKGFSNLHGIAHECKSARTYFIQSERNIRNV